eukprot:TRINITY_DN40326_c0_g1_i2.p1 TRINITY_DN40326_c0_g1~~TRINITY_DN40326_c0_g1_i2.p1  ORF type:complete len:289 (+),score=25.24 TRINITY_DN40326_c0_g1_i2:49-867(+)
MQNFMRSTRRRKRHAPATLICCVSAAMLHLPVWSWTSSVRTFVAGGQGRGCRQPHACSLRRPLPGRPTTPCAFALDTAEETALGVWAGYEELLRSNGVLTDTATTAFIDALSDGIAQTAERKEQKSADLARALRYAAFGTVDGFASHYWVQFLDRLVPDFGAWEVTTTAKVVVDSLVYTPLWCVVFLGMMALLEGRGWQAAQDDISCDFSKLLGGNFLISLPFVACVYGLLPVRFQAAGFATLTLVKTCIISFWASSRDMLARRPETSAADL